MAYQFDAIEWMILTGFCILCVSAILAFRARFSRDGKRNGKSRLPLILSGSFICILSAVYHMHLRSEMHAGLPILQGAAELTSRPLVIISFMSFILGLTLLVIGLLPRNPENRNRPGTPPQIFVD